MHDPYSSSSQDPYKTPDSELHKPTHGQPLKYVGFWLRVFASFVDSILITIIIFPLLYSFYGSQAFTDGFYSSTGILFQYVLPAIVIIIFWIYKSATPGKMLIKAKIVDAKTGHKPSKGQFIGRYLGYFLSTILLFLGFLWILWDRKKQGWHDKLAGTVVVRPSSDGSTIEFESGN